jgi:hypothetical protein
MASQVSSQHRIRARAGALVLGLALMTAATAQAAPIGLSPSTPDITASVAITYGAGVFTASLAGGTGAYTPGGEVISDLTYLLTAAIDSSGVMSSGSVSISGTIASLGVGPSVLLTGDLTDFGFLFDATSPGFGLFEFLFDVTSAAPALGFGTTGGIIMTSLDLSGGSLSGAFRGSATSDSFSSVPEPATLALFALGSLGLAARRRQVSRRSSR